MQRQMYGTGTTQYDLIQAELNNLQSAIQEQNLAAFLAQTNVSRMQGIGMGLKRKSEFQEVRRNQPKIPKLAGGFLDLGGIQNPVASLNALLAAMGQKEGSKFEIEAKKGKYLAKYTKKSGNITCFGETAQVAKYNCAEKAFLSIAATQFQGNCDEKVKTVIGRMFAEICVYKSLADWHSKGFAVPAFPKEWRLMVSGLQESKHEGKPVSEARSGKFFPKTALDFLLNLHEGVLFSSNKDISNDAPYTSSVAIDGETYTGTGKDINEAKENCAKEILTKIHGVGAKKYDGSKQQDPSALSKFTEPIRKIKILRYPVSLGHSEIVGSPPNDYYKVCVDIDGVTCQGQGKTALEAQRNCSKKAIEQALKKKKLCRASGYVNHLYGDDIFKYEKIGKTVKVTASIDGKTYTAEGNENARNAIRERCAQSLLKAVHKFEVPFTPTFKLEEQYGDEKNLKLLVKFEEVGTGSNLMYQAQLKEGDIIFKADGRSRAEAKNNLAIEVLNKHFNIEC